MTALGNTLYTGLSRYITWFHKETNQSNPGKCHATYIMSGVPKPIWVWETPEPAPWRDHEYDAMMENPILKEIVPPLPKRPAPADSIYPKQTVESESPDEIVSIVPEELVEGTLKLEHISGML